MFENLETLLHDAGRDPTRDLDMAAIHAAADGPSTARRAATGVGVLALLGVVIAGIANLTPAEVVIDPIAPTPGSGQVQDAATSPAQRLALAEGVRVAVLSDAGGPTAPSLVLARGDGSTAAGRSITTGPEGVWVDGQETAWWLGDDGVMAAPIEDMLDDAKVVASRTDLSWYLAGGMVEGGAPLFHGAEDFGLGPSSLWTGSRLSDERAYGLVPVDVDLSPPGEKLISAQAGVGDGDGVVLVHGYLGEGFTELTDVSDLLPDGTRTPLITGPTAMDRGIADIAIVGDQVWAADGGWQLPTDLLVVDRSGGDVRRIATPFGRSLDLRISRISVADGTNGAVVVLSTEALDSSDSGPAYRVDVDVLAGALATASAYAPGTSSGDDPPAGLFTELDIVGQVQLLPDAPGPGEATGNGAAAPATVAARYGATVTSLSWDAEEAMFAVTRTSPDGEVSQETFAPGGVLADPIVADDGTIWALAASNALVRQAPSGNLEEVLATEDASGWMPIGFTDDGGVFVVRLATGGVPLEGDGGVSVLYSDGTLLDDYPGVDAAGITGEGGSIHAAAAIAEHVVVLHTGLADGTFATLAPSGQEPRALVPSPSSEIADLTHVAFAGSEAWIVEQRYDAGGGGVDLLFVDVLDPDAPVLRVATPVGRDFEGRVTGIDVAPDDDAIILQLHDADGVRLEPLLIDVAAARSVAAIDTGESATDASGDGSPFARIATRGIVALTAGDGTGQSPDAAACASDDDRVNAPAENEIGVWLTCWDAFQGGVTGYYEAWWRADRFQAANLAAGPDGMRAILQAWLDGPTDAEAARGVTAAGHAGTITIGDIRVDGATVTVELDADGEGGGIPSGTGDGSAWRGAAAAALLQLPAVEAVVLVTDGVCGYWEGGADGDDCITWTDADLPWARGANSECAKQPAQVNLRPGGGGANLWFFCSGANERLGDGVLMPWWRVDDPWPGASLPSDPAARTRFAIEQWVEGPTVEQQALGLSGGLEVGVTLAGVSFEGSRVLIDLAVTTAGTGEFAYEPNWSTSYESIYWATAFASIALQLPEFDELQFTTNGRCEDFALMSEVEPCWVYTDADAAWNQAG